MPCVADAATALAERENTRAAETAFQLYKARMEEGLKLPTKNDNVLTRHHFRCREEATKEFQRLSFLDEHHHHFFEALIVSVGPPVQGIAF